MREIVVDTETTGLDPGAGHRLIELAGIELMNHMPTGRVFQRYVGQPDLSGSIALKIRVSETAIRRSRSAIRKTRSNSPVTGVESMGQGLLLGLT